MKLSDSVNSCLNKMSTVGGTGKGSYGEEAVFKICEQLYQEYGGILYHSYTYHTDPACKGNIKKGEDGHLYCENLGASTEIDVLLVTPFKVFPIEVKAYNASKIVLTDREISGCYKTDKSPVHQNEMHCRHLYQSIFTAIPNGDQNKYIKPIVVFVDKCKVVDQREKWQKQYIKATVLNGLKECLLSLNTPEEYSIDLAVMDRKLRDACLKYEKYLPLRLKQEG